MIEIIIIAKAIILSMTAYRLEFQLYLLLDWLPATLGVA